MANCVDKKTPLQRSGTSQKQRLLPAIKNGYVNADEKSFADWIVFAQSFAGYLNYYELNGELSGDWTPFFNSDVSAVLGSIAVQDADAYKRSIKERFVYLKTEHFASHIAAAEKTLTELFSGVFSFCAALDEFYRLLPNDVALKSGIENLVKTNLKQPLARLISYYKAAKQVAYLHETDFKGWKVLGTKVKDAIEIIEISGLSNLWFTNNSWQLFINSIQRDESIFGNATLDTYFSGQYDPASGVTAVHWLQYMKIKHAANHNLFAGIFDQFLSAYSKLVSGAENELLQSLENRSTHPSHYALFLAFLKLFRFAQDDINTVTQRHLDFYYKQVLQLKPKAAQPNSVHIIAELAKQVDDYILDANTLFKAGKDSEGKDVQYALTNETTFNKAVVKSLRSVFIAPDDLSVPVTTLNNRMYAAPVINSGDGVKAALTTHNKEWHPISNLVYFEDDVIDVKMPAAAIGFAVASHYLYLQEGVRNIMLRLATDDNVSFTGKHYQLFITTKKGWYQIPTDPIVAVNKNLNNGTEDCVEFSLMLDGDEPAIDIYNAAVHGGTFNTNVPMLKILLRNDGVTAYEYKAIRDIRISKLQLAVEVGNINAYSQTGVKNLLLATDAGIIDGSKPFQPFGAMPVAGNRLTIGSKEIFTKQHVKIVLNIEWKGIEAFEGADIAYGTQPDGGQYPNAVIKQYSKGVWSNYKTGIEPFMTGKNFLEQALQPVDAFTIDDFSNEYTAYNSSTKNGFVALELTEGFGHKEYVSALSVYLINKANKVADSSNPKPIEPYTPVVQALYLSYSAASDVVNINDATKISWQQKPASYFHLYPFGDAEQHAFITKNSFHNVWPQFVHVDTDKKIVHHEGEFYIGFENLLAQQSVNVLFQVLDGSADPKVTKPDNHIQWSFLANNQWIDFKPQEVSDATLQLVQPGMVSFTIPAEATIANTILPAGYLWIKASVAEKSNAIGKLLSADAQAAIVSFKDNNNAADFLNTALPASSVAKLKEPQSGIKKISQPYSSFGGRALENSDAFYVRVSERLRHKARAITIWDYEHLILEAFPSIYKVKCLNHTKSNGNYNEVLPGHVTIITIPDLQYRNDVNPLKPYTSQAVLKSVETFLKKRISCHVQLHVVNPVFEEVKLIFHLKLAKGFNDFTIYSKKLKEEITSFLSPWAFTNNADINFGGKVYKSDLINFIEERPYVDFITEVKMTHIFNGGTTPDSSEIDASAARSILVSVAASKHEIEEIKDKDAVQQYECAWLQQQVTGKP
jgi:hypothetical protein